MQRSTVTMFGHRVVVEKIATGYKAYIDGHSPLWGVGKTEHQAIGDFLVEWSKNADRDEMPLPGFKFRPGQRVYIIAVEKVAGFTTGALVMGVDILDARIYKNKRLYETTANSLLEEDQIYLTREEAEQKLAELQEEENG